MRKIGRYDLLIILLVTACVTAAVRHLLKRALDYVRCTEYTWHHPLREFDIIQQLDDDVNNVQCTPCT